MEGCDFVAMGETADEVGMKLMEHGMAVHGMTKESMESPENMAKMQSVMKSE